MMATTHALAGVALGTAVWALVPEAGIIPVLAAALGGLFPDFDLYAGHRKTLHFPVYFSALAVPALAVAAVNPTTTSLAVALFLAAAAVHSASDVLGGGLELKPWLGTSDRAVYDHWNGRWLKPKRLIRYDGSPEDLALTLVLAVPPVVVFDGLVELLVIAAVAISGVYVLLRKPMVVAAERLVAAMPDHLLDHVPERFVRDLR
ncbi:metal-dependent hydrolase [Haloferax larsenii]|uniref:Metal-dependent hydrolase n=1 Tax=Haloferax larsenii TaxID=302484 RepID=A0ABY5REX9_HALLR|nr:metal-dependent hydrolase [Haloferax larsenii]UVE50906.1 metal-dependent hydrolase [Haloferax larsenii]